MTEQLQYTFTNDFENHKAISSARKYNFSYIERKIR